MIDQGVLFGPQVGGEAAAEENSVKYLKDLGYSVIPPSEFTNSKMKEYKDITTADQLVRFFYDRMRFYNPNRRMHHTRSSIDKKYAGLFIKSRMETGISRKRAISECACIIETLFKYEEIFSPYKPIMSFMSLGQSSMGWLTEAVISYINREKSIEAEMIERRELEEMIRKWGEEEYGLK